MDGEDHDYCPTWAGGSNLSNGHAYDQGWMEVSFSQKPGTSPTIVVDLSSIPEGAIPTAVRFAWGHFSCCDHSDPDLFVTKPCIENCPIYTTESHLQANPFMAKIVNSQCECISPQCVPITLTKSLAFTCEMVTGRSWSIWTRRAIAITDITPSFHSILLCADANMNQFYQLWTQPHDQPQGEMTTTTVLTPKHTEHNRMAFDQPTTYFSIHLRKVRT
jgi:hypothetical protein